MPAVQHWLIALIIPSESVWERNQNPDLSLDVFCACVFFLVFF